MNARAIQRTAIDSTLTLARLPLDRAVTLLPSGSKPAVKLALDRTDARLRTLIGTLLNDPVLREAARLRQAAAQERERGLRLREQAERTSEKADARLEQRQDQASRQREQANTRAKSRRQAAERDARRKQDQAAKTEAQRLDANARTADQVEELINEREPQERLEALDAQQDAQREKRKELAAREEARRLRDSASAAKANRKAS